MKLICFILLITIAGCLNPKEQPVFCYIEMADNITSKAVIEFEIDGSYKKEVVSLPYQNIYYVERYIKVSWLPQKYEYNGFLRNGRNKYFAEKDEWDLYKVMQINIKKPNGMNGVTWID